MKGIVRFVVVGLAAATLSACAGLEYGSVKSMTPAANATAFDQALYTEYLALAKYEFEQGDYPDSDIFARRARDAAQGKKFGPEEVSARPLPESAVPEMRDANGRLVRALGAGAAEKAPKAAAKAQASFDCWMEQQELEENFQPDDIAACKKSFMMAMNEIDAAMQTRPVAAPAVPAPAPAAKPAVATGPFTVFFDFNSSQISEQAKKTITQAADAIKAASPNHIVVTGHTDRAGANGYNRNLSQQRAAAVAKAVGATNAIAGARIVTRALGETAPQVATPDGQREPANRRVTIELMNK